MRPLHSARELLLLLAAAFLLHAGATSASVILTPEQLEALRVLVQDVRTAADRAEAALEEISL